MTDAPFMPKATAVWLVENTNLTFKQIAEFCKLHELEIKGIADGDVARGIKAYNPILAGQLSREEIEKCSNDPSKKLTLGLPFYGRDHTGHWTTYEDILSKHYDKIKGNNKEMNVDKVLDIGFNSVVTIEEKTKYAIKKRIGGVMIWEIGQDCRIKEVKEKNGLFRTEICL